MRTDKERSTQYGGDVVPLNYLAKRRALGKLRSMYGISLPDKVDPLRLSDDVAQALQIPRPQTLEEASRMVAAFAAEVPVVGEGADPVAVPGLPLRPTAAGVAPDGLGGRSARPGRAAPRSRARGGRHRGGARPRVVDGGYT